MSFTTYSIDRSGTDLVFYFESSNRQGGNPVFKIVSYVPISRYGSHYYNLGFGDYNFETGGIDDQAVSDNGDMRKILATVISTLKTFFAEHPGQSVHIDGSTPTRHAYYHKLVTDYSHLISELYIVEGCINGVVQPFKKGNNTNSCSLA